MVTTTLAAYFDESGTHAGSEAVAVAGYVSTPERWLDFESEWRGALLDYGLAYFHMTDFANGAKSYAHWPQAQKRIRFDRLANIINRHVIGSVGTVIPVQSYERIFNPAAKKHVGGPYGLAATANFLAIARILRGMNALGHDLWVEYTFETGARGAGQVRRAFDYNAHDPTQRAELRVGSLAFADKPQAVPLQAADVLAYELYRHLPRQLGLDPRPLRGRHLSRLREPANDWGYLDDAELRMWSEVTTIAARLAETQGWPRKRLPDDWSPDSGPTSKPP